MAFRKNETQQMNMSDPIYGLTERELRVLRKSWAESFANHIFPNLAEEPFSVLYSTNEASKPNTPVNIILGLLMLKEQFGLTDEELMHQMMFNAQFQYALHTSSFHEQPINDNTLRRFRNLICAYEDETGIDLIKKAFDSLRDEVSSIMDIDPSLKRIDSLMISSACRRLSRLDIMGETLRLAARELNKSGNATQLSEKYAEDGGSRESGYRLKREEVPAKMEEMLRDAIAMFEAYPEEFLKSDSFTALRRMIDDQSKMTEDGRVLKEGSEISPESMQTPHEQDATFRKKAGKHNIGFVANIVEACGDGINLIVDYDVQKNTYSDAKFAEDIINGMPDSGGETTTITMDGAYASTDLVDKAKAKNIEIATTSLIGGMNGTFEAEFEIDDAEDVIVKCPAGCSPIDSKRGNGFYSAHFDDEICAACPLCDQCPGVFQTKSALIKFTDAALKKAQYAKNLGTEKYDALARKRNGIEGVPSVLRRKYDVDEMHDKGIERKRHRFGFKMMAINAGRLFGWRKKTAGAEA